MAIWNQSPTLESLNHQLKGNMCEHVGIEITDIGDDYLVGTLPVDKRTVQPMGLLHGGANVVLAETLGSIAANLACGNDQYCVGLEINANHLKSATSGKVTGTARPVHIGRSTQVWEIRIENEQGSLTCISRLTMAAKSNRG
ncbi:hotdog fold thioesterase [Endozoicomonas euniceicola]|uniref:Hotdog fold thioesterase n=1 Tax=Endozoicomonas euniceicola TaxID=1234143 RepID=A0ABY6GP60_9GAMM|nr:hotdog fold thioesterase [Endozoicomonas euniceicola]UYM13861.1 hotdog fold thioesterase [Endozoicomonas euniceicola]